MERTELNLTNAAALRAMAHPLRMSILGSLRIDGPATSAMLARRLNTDSGQTSFHLRQLARFGFVVEAPDLGKGPRGRERWWRAGHETTSWASSADLGPGGEEAVFAFENVVHQVWAQMASQYRMEIRQNEWSRAWIDSAAAGDYPIRTTPEGLRALLSEIRAAMARHDVGRQAVPGAETVVLVLHAIPRKAVS
jgi:hypothetical protein